MKVSRNDLAPRQVSLEIEVDQERVDRAMDQAYRRIAGRVNVPGFRRGKAPRTLVERMIGPQAIAEDAIEHLIPDVVAEAIKQEELEPFVRPRVDSIEMEPLRIKATVPLAPEVKLGELSKLRIERREPTVEPAQVEEVINRTRESYAQWVPVERAVSKGDRVGIDLRGVVEETNRELLDSRDAEYVVDDEGPQPAPGFADEIVGLGAGDEKTFTLTLPEDYRDSTLAGKAVAFEVKVHWVKERELPEVDDAFAQQLGDFQDAASLRETVERQLRERAESQAREESLEAALAKLVEISTIEVPPQVVDLQAEQLVESFRQNIERQGIKLDQYLSYLGKDEDTFRQEMQERASTRVHQSLAFSAFVEAEKLSVEDADVEAEIEKSAEGNAGMVAQLSTPEGRTRVEEALRERRAFDRLLEIASAGDGAATKTAKSGKGKGSKSGGGTAKEKIATSSQDANDTETDSSAEAPAPAASGAKE